MVNKLTKSLGILLIVFCFLFLAAFIAVSIHDSPEFARRLLMYGQSDINDYRIFPERVIQKGDTVSVLEKSDGEIPENVTWLLPTGETRTESLQEVFRRTDTKAFIVIRDDKILYEGYFNGAKRDSINTSFSTAKSFNSALIGAAIADGKIDSVDDPVIHYIPEFSGRGLDALTIRDLLLMSTGIRYRHNSDLPFYLHLFGDDALTYYSPDLRQTALRPEASEAPVGSAWLYNNYHPLLEGLILERVTGMSVSEYLQERIWKPMGAEYAASWSLDSERSGFEKMESGINARAVDYARFGLIFLHNGFWNGVQILPENWILESTAPEGSWSLRQFNPEIKPYYKYHWWGFSYTDGAYDYSASGHYGQTIYIAPRKNMVIVRLGGASDKFPVPWFAIIQDLIDQMP